MLYQPAGPLPFVEVAKAAVNVDAAHGGVHALVVQDGQHVLHRLGRQVLVLVVVRTPDRFRDHLRRVTGRSGVFHAAPVAPPRAAPGAVVSPCGIGLDIFLIAASPGYTWAGDILTMNFRDKSQSAVLSQQCIQEVLKR